MARTSGTGLAALVLVAILAASCADDDGTGAAADSATGPEPSSTTTTAPDPRAWPDDDWDRIAPAAAGIDQAELDALAADAEASGSRCLAVFRDGELVADWYWKGSEPATESEAWSVTKSITATLVGIAQDEGHLDIDQPASDFITEWQGTESEGVTIRNLISNDSGRYHDNATDYGQMAAIAPDKTAFSIELGQEFDPGTDWVYNNAAIQTLEAALERATGVPVDEYAAEKLFSPIGMSSDMTFDRAGNTLVFMGMQSSCLDLGRFGLLYLRDGEWDGEQVLSEDFVAEATAPSQDLNPSYGYLWWLLGSGDRETAAGQGSLGDGASGYAALGLGDQVMAVFPDDDIVVTRMGDAGGGFGAAQISEWVGALELDDEG